jgi:hypothetical protein
LYLVALAAGVFEAAAESAAYLYEAIAPGASLAVISVAAADGAEGEFVLEDLTLRLVNSKKFRMVDRRSLDIIRAEQRFQLSGEVDDDTAVSIGRMIGAEIVITGGIQRGIYEIKNASFCHFLVSGFGRRSAPQCGRGTRGGGFRY